MATSDAIRDGEPGSAGPAEVDVVLDETFDIGNLVALRAAVAAHAAELGLSPSRVGELVLVAHELASNAIRHGGGEGRLLLWVDAGIVHCRVCDRGPGLPEAHPGEPWQPPVDALGGRGLWLAHHLCDRFEVRSGADGTAATASMTIADRPHGS